MHQVFQVWMEAPDKLLRLLLQQRLALQFPMGLAQAVLLEHPEATQAALGVLQQ
jgi:hypothetical protein